MAAKGQPWHEAGTGFSGADAAHFVGLYDGEVHYADEQVGRVLDAMRDQKLLRNTLVILASDRARMIARGDVSLVECENKPAVTALREIAKGFVEFQEDVRAVVNEFIEERKAAGYV